MTEYKQTISGYFSIWFDGKEAYFKFITWLQKGRTPEEIMYYVKHSHNIDGDFVGGIGANEMLKDIEYYSKKFFESHYNEIYEDYTIYIEDWDDLRDNINNDYDPYGDIDEQQTSELNYTLNSIICTVHQFNRYSREVNLNNKIYKWDK